MEAAIHRFQMRMGLSPSLTFKVVRCKEIINIPLHTKYRVHLGGENPLQLYHAIKPIFDKKITNDIVENICRVGFVPSHRGNKGIGIYLANHSRYSLLWAGTQNPVIICDIAPISQYIKRFRSEIYSHLWNSEYLISEPSIIYPRYVLSYTVEGSAPIPTVFTPLGHFNCPLCDKKLLRCDCPLSPTINPTDLIEG